MKYVSSNKIIINEGKQEIEENIFILSEHLENLFLRHFNFHTHLSIAIYCLIIILKLIFILRIPRKSNLYILIIYMIGAMKLFTITIP